MTGDSPGFASLRERKKRATRAALHQTALRLVSEQGAAGVTVEEICDEVGISPRTFFNYFPTKLDAAFDLAPAEIPPAQAEAFLAADGDLIADALRLLTASADLPTDYARIRTLLREQPELAMSFWKQTMGRLKPVHALMQQRAGDTATARLAFGILAVAALSSMMRPGNDGDTAGAAGRLALELAEMKQLIAGVDEPGVLLSNDTPGDGGEAVGSPVRPGPGGGHE